MEGGGLCGFNDSVGINVMKLVLMKLMIKVIKIIQVFAVVWDFNDGYNVVTTIMVVSPRPSVNVCCQSMAMATKLPSLRKT
jgi:hypothetical protein